MNRNIGIFNMKPFSQQDLIRNQVRIASCLLNIRSGNLLQTTTAVSIFGILESGSERSLQAEGIRCDRIGILYCRHTRVIRDSADTGSEDTGVSYKEPGIEGHNDPGSEKSRPGRPGIRKNRAY